MPRLWAILRLREPVSLLDRLVTAASGALLLLTVFSWLGHAFWLPELVTHFRMQLLTGAAVVFPLACLRRNPVGAIAAFFVAAASAWPLSPYLLPGSVDAHTGRPSTRILFVNVMVGNDNYGALRRLVRVENPDIVALAEVDDHWLDALVPLQAEYPYTVLHPDTGPHGLALFSRFPVRELEISPYIENGVQTALMVELETPQANLSVYLAHPNSPVTPRHAALRNVQLRALSSMIRSDQNRERILIGDLNVTPWSPHYSTLEEDGKLTNAAIGRGYSPTWPTWMHGASFLQIPIDHCLLSEGLRVQGFRTGKEIGSDHLPLVVDIAVSTQTAFSQQTTGY